MGAGRDGLGALGALGTLVLRSGGWGSSQPRCWDPARVRPPTSGGDPGMRAPELPPPPPSRGTPASGGWNRSQTPPGPDWALLGSYWLLRGHTRSFRVRTGPDGAILVSTGLILVPMGPYWSLRGLYWSIWGHTGLFRVHTGPFGAHTGLFGTTLVSSGFILVHMGPYWFL